VKLQVSESDSLRALRGKGEQEKGKKFMMLIMLAVEKVKVSPPSAFHVSEGFFLPPRAD
jgi:hypothetical protein